MSFIASCLVLCCAAASAGRRSTGVIVDRKPRQASVSSNDADSKGNATPRDAKPSRRSMQPQVKPAGNVGGPSASSKPAAGDKGPEMSFQQFLQVR